MKKTIFIFFLLSTVCCLQLSAQWSNKTLIYGSITRSYRVYQSPNYNASFPASLLIALHGLGDNMTNFSSIGFNYIADTANIICIFPQAVSDPYAGTAWNSGAGSSGYYPNSGVNDIGFINALIDTAIANYTIDNSRVYLCGFSMGGFMTERMALQSNTRIAAFASMSGTFGSGITNFSPGRHVPIAHFHGTADATVLYTGNTYGSDPDSLIRFWALNNACNPTPTIYSYPNLVNDGISVDRIQYSNGDPQSDVWFYKMNGAGHTVLFQPANDITEAYELWLFLSRHRLGASGIIDPIDFSHKILVFPNPAHEEITIIFHSSEVINNASLSVYSIQGALLLQQTILHDNTKIDIHSLSKGLYYYQLSNKKGNVISGKFVKQ
ncbi:MAG: T9SS type A sorting domain-containing protein [Bacteroidota bacterium]